MLDEQLEIYRSRRLIGFDKLHAAQTALIHSHRATGHRPDVQDILDWLEQNDPA